MTRQVTDWSDERVERLKELWAAGGSASQVARVIGGGATRSAVIGKVHRLGLPLRQEAWRGQGNGSPRPRPPTPPKPAAPAQPPPEPLEALVLDGGAHVTILTIGDKLCRWPIGDPMVPGFHFCGRAPQAGSPYCDGHARRAYQPKVSTAGLRAQDGRATNGAKRFSKSVLLGGWE